MLDIIVQRFCTYNMSFISIKTKVESPFSFRVIYFSTTLDKLVIFNCFTQNLQVSQGPQRLEKYLNIQDCLEKSLKINLP